MTEHFDTALPVTAAPKRPFKVIIPLLDAQSDKDAVKALYTSLTSAPRYRLTENACPESKFCALNMDAATSNA